MSKEVLIVRGIDAKYVVRLAFDSEKELARVASALRSLGYKFRVPQNTY